MDFYESIMDISWIMPWMIIHVDHVMKHRFSLMNDGYIMGDPMDGSIVTRDVLKNPLSWMILNALTAMCGQPGILLNYEVSEKEEGGLKYSSCFSMKI